MGNQKNYYVLLGIPRNASQDEIRRAYHTAARRLHPDVNKEPNAGTVFLSIQQAYETLNNPEERAKYDKDQAFESEDPPIKINTIYSRSSVVQLDEPQLIYALIEIKPRKSGTEFNAPPLNLCLVLDRSTSMQGARLEIVKDTAIDLTQQLSPRDLLSIVTFSDNPEVLVPSGMLLDQRTIENRIRSLKAGGGTEIFRGMKAGYQELRKNLRPSYINHLILITDGRTYGDEEDCLDIATQSASMGIGFSGLGIGNQWNDAFLDSLATRTGGNSAYIPSIADIGEFLKKKIRLLGQMFAEGLTLDVDIDPNVEIRYAFRLEPEISQLDPKPPIPLGDLPLNGVVRLILEILVPPIPSGSGRISLADGILRLSIPNQEIPFHNLPISFDRPITTTLGTEPSPMELKIAIERITLYRMQEKARKEFTAGDIDNATRHLENLAARLLTSGQSQLAQTVKEEIDHIKQGDTYSEEGNKQIKYGTRSLLHPVISDGKIK